MAMPMWLWKSHWMWSYSIAERKKKSCGCRKIGEKHYHWSGYKGISGYFWRGILGGAKTRNLAVSLTPQQAWELFEKQRGRCALTNVRLTFCRDEHGVRIGEQTASLDRIDSSRGYEIDNVQWVHKVVNIMKNDMSLPELVRWCKKIVRNVWSNMTSHYQK